jgi:hypothetical protein
LYQFPDAAYPAAAATAAASSSPFVVVSSLLLDHDDSLGGYNPIRIHHEEPKKEKTIGRSKTKKWQIEAKPTWHLFWRGNQLDLTN